jgi:ATP-dependent DNA helicase RecG
VRSYGSKGEYDVYVFNMNFKALLPFYQYQDFANMSKNDRIRACYQHCCLPYVSNQRMSSQTLRERFKLPESGAATISLVIGSAKEAGMIKPDDTETNSIRYARYLPFWA